MIHRLMVPKRERARINEVFQWFRARSKKDVKALGLNGCGSKVTGWIVPELAFYEACCLHDLLYLMGGSRRDRRIADAIFLDLMLGTVRFRRAGFLRKLRWRLAAHAYFWAVRCFGGASFKYGTRQTLSSMASRLWANRKTGRA